MISKLLLTGLIVSANSIGFIFNKDNAVIVNSNYLVSNGITNISSIYQYQYDLWDRGFSMEYRYIRDTDLPETRYYVATMYRLSETPSANSTEKNTSLALIAKMENTVISENNEDFLTRIFAFPATNTFDDVYPYLTDYEITTTSMIAQNATVAHYHNSSVNNLIYLSLFPITSDMFFSENAKPLFYPFIFGYSDSVNKVTFRPISFASFSSNGVITNSRITLSSNDTRDFMLANMLQIDFVLVSDLANIITVISSNQAYQDGYNAGLIDGIDITDIGGANLLSTTVITVIGSVGNFIYLISGFEIMGISLMTIIAFIFAFGIIAIVIKVVK